MILLLPSIETFTLGELKRLKYLCQSHIKSQKLRQVKENLKKLC